MSESTIMLAVQDALIKQVHAAINVNDEMKLELICAIDRLNTPALVHSFLNLFSFIMEFEMVTTSLQEDFEADKSAMIYFDRVLHPLLTLDTKFSFSSRYSVSQVGKKTYNALLQT